MISKTTKIKPSSSNDHNSKKVIINEKKKINTIPKKERKYYNISPKVMLSSTNYSNNISNSFKEEINFKKENHKRYNNSYCLNESNEKKALNNLKYRLENIKNRTKNLLEIYSNMYKYKSAQKGIKNKNDANKNILKNCNYSHYIKKKVLI